MQNMGFDRKADFFNEKYAETFTKKPAYELVAVLIKLEIHRRRVEDGPDEVPLGGVVAGPDDDGLDDLVPVLPGLDDLGAAPQCVFLVLLAVVEKVRGMTRKACLGDGNTLPSQHALVHDGLTLQQDGVTEQLTAVVRNNYDVPGHQLRGYDLLTGAVRSEPSHRL